MPHSLCGVSRTSIRLERFFPKAIHTSGRIGVSCVYRRPLTKESGSSEIHPFIWGYISFITSEREIAIYCRVVV